MMTTQLDRLGRRKPHKGRIQSMQTCRLEEIKANDYCSHSGTDFGAYADDIDNELLRRYEKKRLMAERSFRRKQRQELKHLESTCPF
jgi:hypothetical protein